MFDEIVESLHQGIVVFNLDSCEITYLNQSFSNALQYKKKELIGRNFTSLLAIEHREYFPAILNRLKKGDQVVSEAVLTKQNGLLLEVELSFKKKVISDEEVAIGLVIDITETKSYERSLLESERFLSTLVSNLPGYYYRVRNDANYTTEYLSNGFIEIVGYESELFLSGQKHLIELVHEEDLEPIMRDFAQAVENKSKYELTFRMYTKTNAIKWVWERGQGIYNNDGELIAFEGFVTDITTQKERESLLERQERELSLIYNNTSNMMVLYRVENDQFFLMNYNESFSKILSRQQVLKDNQEIKGMEIREFFQFLKFDDDQVKKRMNVVNHCMESGRSIEIELHTPVIDQADKYFKVKISSIKNQQNENTHLLVVISDITSIKNSEEHLKNLNRRLEIAESIAQLGSWGYDYQTGERYWSDQMFRLFDLEVQEKPPSTDVTLDRIQVEDRESYHKEIEKLFKEKKDLFIKVFRTNPEKMTSKYLRQVFKVVRGVDGEVQGVNGTLQDITNEHVIKQRLEESEARFKELAELLPEAVFETNGDFILTYANKKALELFGYSTDDLKMGINGFDLFSNQDNYHVIDTYNSLLESVRKGAIEHVGKRKDLSTYVMLSHFGTIETNGEIVGFRAVIIDITERKLLEKDLEKRKQHLENIVMARTGEIARERDRAHALYSLSLKINQVTDKMKLLQYVFNGLKQLIPCDITTLQVVEGEMLHVAFHDGYDDPNHFDKYTKACDQDELFLKISNEKDAVLIADLDELSIMDHSVIEFGISNLIIIPIYSINELSGYITLAQTDKRKLSSNDLQTARSIGATVSISLTNSELFRLANDERKRAEDALIELKLAKDHLVQSERLASLGLITAGVAHELNNPINAISSSVVGIEREIPDLFSLLAEYSKLETLVTDRQDLVLIHSLKQKLDLDNLKELLESILVDLRTGSGRVVDIVRGLKSFSRQGNNEKVKIDIHNYLEDTLLLLRLQFKNKLQVIKDYDENLQPIKCYAGELNQVFMNILVNAEQSIPHEGIIWIRTRDHEKYIVIEIEDNGVGMSEETKAHIFDPFFTTKDLGKGTGLGLSISYGIIEKHGGKINVMSHTGKGSQFQIVLPK